MVIVRNDLHLLRGLLSGRLLRSRDGLHQGLSAPVPVAQTIVLCGLRGCAAASCQQTTLNRKVNRQSVWKPQ